MPAKFKSDVTVVLPAKYTQVMFEVSPKTVIDKGDMESRIEAIKGVHEATVESDGSVTVLLDAKITTQRQANPVVLAVLRELDVQPKGRISYDQDRG